MLQDLVLRIKERSKHKNQLNDRKSLAAQNRMKAITAAASELPSSKKKRKRTGDDTFGQNDSDWAVYREIVLGLSTCEVQAGADKARQGGADDSEEEEDEQTQLAHLEAQLLEHDPTFTKDDTAEKVTQRKTQLLNAFIRGVKPTDEAASYEPSNPAHAAQLHINIERIKVPEVLYQPQMAGVDQAGLLELVENVLRNFTSAEQNRLVQVG